MTNRERFQAVMNFQPVDRLPVVEWAGWWGETIERWHGEKLPRGLTDRYDICRHFGLDIFRQMWYGAAAPGCPAAPHHGAGIVKTEAEYDALLEHLYPWPVVDAGPWREWREEQRRGESVVWCSLDGFFWFPRALFGIEAHLCAFYDHPDLMHRMNADLAAQNIRVVNAVCDQCVPDFFCLAEDMSYNHGPMLSQRHFDEFLRPYYERVIPVIHERGALVFVDTDGDVTIPMAWYESVGVDGFLPLERMAGVDVAALREAHPHMRFLGAFDKTVMHRGEAAIRGEFERLMPVARAGGFVISCDHQTPPGVSYDDYRLYLRLLREYGETS